MREIPRFRRKARDECKEQGSAIIRKAAVTSLTLAKSIAKCASDKKAEDIILLDMRKVANFCDFFVLCAGSSNRQVRAIADGIDEGASLLGSKIGRKQGVKDGRWVVLDMGDVVAHVFDNETREFYGLEYLWQEAKRVKWES